jgi:hypothetical protein
MSLTLQEERGEGSYRGLTASRDLTITNTRRRERRISRILCIKTRNYKQALRCFVFCLYICYRHSNKIFGSIVFVNKLARRAEVRGGVCRRWWTVREKRCEIVYSSLGFGLCKEGKEQRTTVLINEELSKASK